MREPPNIPQERLRACFQDQYDLTPISLEFLPRGKDFHAGVYRVVSEQGTPYLLKVKSASLYQPSCLVPAYLRNQGITAVVAPIPTRNHALWTKLGDWTVIVYPFHDGDTSLTGMTNEQWKQVGTTFKQIHQVPFEPVAALPLRQETFDPTKYARWVHAFETSLAVDETHHLHSPHADSESSRALRADWLAHQSTIHAAVATLEKLAAVLQQRPFPHVICHADLHPANLLRDHSGHVFVIDWDDVMLAPKERDFIFLREPQTDAFWQGYGHIDIDWTELTYYRWERVVQDLIECARDVCISDDLGAETRADAAHMFHEILAADNSNIAAAHAAAAHLAP